MLNELLSENIGSITPDVVLLCETWLNNHNINKVVIPNYKLIGNVRNGKIGGGTGILMHKSLKCREHKDLEIKSLTFEHTVVELKTESSNLLLVSGYRPPNSNTKEFLKDYKLAIKTWQKLKHHNLVIGIDHNLDFLKSEKHPQTQTFLEFNLESDMLPTITRPTRVTRTSATLIDNVFISKRLQNNCNSLILLDDISDHFPSLVSLNNQRCLKKEPKKIKTREINDKKISQIMNKLDRIEWVKELTDLDADNAFSSFHKHLVETIESEIPEKTKTLSYKRVIRDPWLTVGLQKCMKKQQSLYGDTLTSKEKTVTAKYRWYRDALKKLIRHCKSQYYLNKCIEFKRNSRKLWGLINRVISKGNLKSDSIDKIKVGSSYRTDAKSITTAFCDHFASVGKCYANKIGKSNKKIENYLKNIKVNRHTLFLSPIVENDLRLLINALLNRMSSGYDNINNVLLKQLCNSLLKPMTLCINKSLSEGQFPQSMKLANVYPLFKSKDKSETNNYRPISLLLTLSKLLEKLVYEKVYHFLNETEQIYNSQYGFRSGHSCKNTVGELFNAVLKGFQCLTPWSIRS